MSSYVTTSTEKRLNDLALGLNKDAVDELRRLLRYKQAREIGRDHPDTPLPLVTVEPAEGKSRLEKLEELREQKKLQWSAHSLSYEAYAPDDPDRYCILTDDNDLISILDDADIPDEIRSSLREHLTAMTIQPDAELRIMNRLILLNTPTLPQSIILKFLVPSNHSKQFTAAAAVAETVASEPDIHVAESGDELHIYKQKGKDIWPAVLRMKTRPQSEAVNVAIQLGQKTIKFAEPPNRFGVTKIYRSDFEY